MTAAAYASTAPEAPTRIAAATVGATFAAVGPTLTVWSLRVRTRAALRRVDAARFDDLGLSAFEVRHEIGKPFWRA